MKTQQSKAHTRKKTVNKSGNKSKPDRGTKFIHRLPTGCPPLNNRLSTVANPTGDQIAKHAAEKALERMRILIWRLEELEKITGQAIDGLQPMLRNLRHEAFPHFEAKHV